MWLFLSIIFQQHLCTVQWVFIRSHHNAKACFFCLFATSVSPSAHLAYRFVLPCIHQLLLGICFCLNYISEKILSRILVVIPKRKSNWTGSPFKSWSHIIGHKIACELTAIGSTAQLTQPSVSVHAAAPVQKRVGRAHTSRINFKLVLVHLGHGKKHTWIFQLEFCSGQ